MHLQNVYQCTSELLPPLTKGKPLTYADMKGKLQAPMCDLPLYGCHFGYTALTGFSKAAAYIAVHKDVLVNSYTDVDGLKGNIDLPTESLIENFVKLKTTSGPETCITYNPLRVGSPIKFSVPEYLLLMITYAITYDSGRGFSHFDMTDAVAAIAEDNMFDMTTEQKVVERCDTKKVLAVLNEVDFDYERKYKINPTLYCGVGDDSESLMAIGYIATAFLAHGVINSEEANNLVSKPSATNGVHK